jgi:hypothetical protein
LADLVLSFVWIRGVWFRHLMMMIPKGVWRSWGFSACLRELAVQLREDQPQLVKMYKKRVGAEKSGNADAAKQ